MKWILAIAAACFALLLAPPALHAQRLPGSAPVPPGSIKGEVYDSLSGQAAAHAFVFVSGTPIASQADANGRFTLSDVPPGTYFVAFTLPELDSLGLNSLGAKVDVHSGETTRITLATPSFRAMWKSLCSWSERVGPDSGIVWGTVRDAATDTRLSNAATAFNWYDLGMNAQKRPTFSEITRTVRTDSTGTYYACGLPERINLTTEAAGSHSASGVVEYSIGNRRIRRLDLLVSTDMVLSPTVSLKTAADSNALRAHGSSSVNGVVRGPDGKTLANALVTVASTDSSVRTNANGEFSFSGLPAGTHMLQVRQVGFSPAAVNVDLRAGRTTETSIEMPSAKTLATFNVRANLEAGADRLGFEDRKRAGFGYSMLLKDMENRPDVASVLREMPSVSVTIQRGVPNISLPGRLGGTCAANLWLDGTKAIPEQIASYRPEDFRAVEVFPREISVPAQYINPSGSGCGAVLFWTKFAKW